MSLRLIRTLFLLSAALALAGRSYQHVFIEGPYRAFFLDETLFGYWQGLFSDQLWLDFTNSHLADQRIRIYTRVMGFIWLATAIVFLFFNRLSAKISWSLAIISSLGLMFYGACSYLNMGYQSAQWIEHSAQILMPLLAVWVQQTNGRDAFWLLTAKVAIALTFTGHGLYAMGYFPVPGNFVYMTNTILGTSDEVSKDFLYVAGIFDLLAAALLFVPKADRLTFLYCAFWGFVTALARPVTYLVPNHLFWLTIHQTIFEFLVRLPHFMLPLLAWGYLRILAERGPRSGVMGRKNWSGGQGLWTRSTSDL